MITHEADANLPTTHGTFRIHVFRNAQNGKEEIALVKQPFTKDCVTSEVFNSQRCDCDEQLQTALHQISKRGGILIYLRQEGRDIGLANKIKAYNLQDNGADTVDANLQLGLEEDSRNYRIAASILKYFHLTTISLLTNNPEKATQLKQYGIHIKETLPIQSIPNKSNRLYIETKQLKMGHTTDVKKKLMFL
jgi:3,4-dihydroxy 2-butanone 4-phosphate synthase / GTP cyclohydrolase II